MLLSNMDDRKKLLCATHPTIMIYFPDRLRTDLLLISNRVCAVSCQLLPKEKWSLGFMCVRRTLVAFRLILSQKTHSIIDYLTDGARKEVFFLDAPFFNSIGVFCTQRPPFYTDGYVYIHKRFPFCAYTLPFLFREAGFYFEAPFFILSCPIFTPRNTGLITKISFLCYTPLFIFRNVIIYFVARSLFLFPGPFFILKGDIFIHKSPLFILRNLLFYSERLWFYIQALFYTHRQYFCIEGLLFIHKGHLFVLIPPFLYLETFNFIAKRLFLFPDPSFFLIIQELFVIK